MKRKRTRLQRVCALLLAILLLCLFAATLLVGIFGGREQIQLLRVLIFLDVVIPVIIYGFVLITRQLKRPEPDKKPDDGDQ